MQVTEFRCDRCEKKLNRPSITVTVNYHHPKKLEFCESCEGEFTMWLGKHPLWGTPMSNIVDGGSTGEGFPSQDLLNRKSQRYISLRES